MNGRRCIAGQGAMERSRVVARRRDHSGVKGSIDDRLHTTTPSARRTSISGTSNPPCSGSREPAFSCVHRKRAARARSLSAARSPRTARVDWRRSSHAVSPLSRESNWPTAARSCELKQGRDRDRAPTRALVRSVLTSWTAFRAEQRPLGGVAGRRRSSKSATPTTRADPAAARHGHDWRSRSPAESSRGPATRVGSRPVARQPVGGLIWPWRDWTCTGAASGWPEASAVGYGSARGATAAHRRSDR